MEPLVWPMVLTGAGIVLLFVLGVVLALAGWILSLGFNVAWWLIDRVTGGRA